jgi:hypothetical protein
MVSLDVSSLSAQLDAVISSFGQLKSRSGYSDLSDLPHNETAKLLSQARAAVHRIAGADSVYAEQVDASLDRKLHDGTQCFLVVGVVEALRADMAAGYLETLIELVHGELFGDFLEMAEHLLNEGFKDAAAVIAGGTLESHLRQLCKKHSIPVDVPTAAGTK